MNVSRLCCIGIALTCLPATVAHSQEFPSKPLRIVAPFPPGGAVDILARIVATPMSRSLGQNVIVENRAGGNTVIGAELVARAPADGHTLLFMASSFTINPFVRSKMPYDTVKDFTAVTLVAANPMVISVHPSLPAKTLKELVSLARARPGELTFATASIIGGQRMAAEAFKDAAKIDIVNIPYNGGAPAATAVMGGHTSMLVTNAAETASHISSGRLRALAVTSATRAETFPNVPTIAESGYPGFEAINWFGAVARSATPKAVVDRLSAEIGRALQQTEVRDGLSKLGLTGMPMTPEAFGDFLRAEMQKNEKILKVLKLRIE
jgi:tripartite-type tricarboxylate transporter receptor subunit TctC